MGFSTFNPTIDLFSLKLPQLADAVGREAFGIDPAVDGVFGDAEVFGDFFSG
jgi:hypothetical protein